VKVDWWTLPLVRGDRFLLCSDGLVDEVADADIVATLLEHADPQEAADSLIAQANEAGGRDNVTVIVLDVLDGDDPPDPTQELDLTPTWADDPDVSPEDIARIQAGHLEGVGADPTDEIAAKAGRRHRRRDRRQAKELAETAAAAAAAGALVTATTDDEGDEAADDTPDTPPKKRPRLIKAIGIFVLLAILVTGFVSTAAWARRGFFVEFNNSGQVVLYQGRPGGFLWIDPTLEATGAANRDELTDASVTLVEARPTFSSLSDATLFIRGLDLVEAAADNSATPSDSPTTTVFATTTARATTTVSPTTTAAAGSS
jgi:protein phosphatase